jgi:hypothetical protein
MEKYKFKIFVIFLFIILLLISLVTVGVKSSFFQTNTMKDENILPTISYIHGVVRQYPDGTPIPGARVEFRKSVSLPWKSARSDENGEYFIELRNMIFFPKYYVMWAVSADFHMLPTYIEVKNRRNFDITKDLWLAPPNSGRIYGYITDRENNPINDATVELLIYPFDDTYEITNTTSDGYYSFSLLNIDIYKIYVEKTGYRIPIIPPDEIYLGRDGNFDIQFNFKLVKGIDLRTLFDKWLSDYFINKI